MVVRAFVFRLFYGDGIGGDTVPARKFADFRRGGIGGGWIIFGLVVVHFVNGGGYYWRHGELLDRTLRRPEKVLRAITGY